DGGDAAPDPALIIGHRDGRRNPHQARASLQYRTHLATSATALEPCGILYSTSMSAGNVHFSFFISCKISLSGVPPMPHGTFPPSAVRSFMCRLTMRS